MGVGRAEKTETVERTEKIRSFEHTALARKNTQMMFDSHVELLKTLSTSGTADERKERKLDDLQKKRTTECTEEAWNQNFKLQEAADRPKSVACCTRQTRRGQWMHR